MKMVVAVIKPFKLDEVKEALARLSVEGIVVREALLGRAFRTPGW